MDLFACLIALGACLFGVYLYGAFQVSVVLRFLFNLPTFKYYRNSMNAESGRVGRFLLWLTYIVVGWGWNLLWCGLICAKYILLGRPDVVPPVLARELFASAAQRTHVPDPEILDMVLSDLKKVEARFQHPGKSETSSSA